MRCLAREEQALCLSLYAFSETMFKTSMGKRETFILRRKRRSLFCLLEKSKLSRKPVLHPTLSLSSETKMKDGAKSDPKRSSR